MEENKLRFDYYDKAEFKKIPIVKKNKTNDDKIYFTIRKYKLKNGECSFSGGIHRHEFMQVNYVFDGKGVHSVNNHEFEVIKGDIFIIPPFVPHLLKAGKNEEVEIFEIEFEPSFINQNFDNIEGIESIFDFAYIEPFLVSEKDVKPRLNLMGTLQVEVENIYSEILKEYEEMLPGYKQYIKSLLLKLLIMVGRAFTNDLGKDDFSLFSYHRDAVLKSVNYIEENYMHDISIKDLTRISMLSQSYFCYLFKSITSKTFKEYQTGIRLSKAKEFLKTTNMKIFEIAEEVGYNSNTHFNKIFKRYIGVTPYEYRKKK